MLQGVILSYKAQGGETVIMFPIDSSRRDKHFKGIKTDFLKMCIRTSLRGKYIF